VNGNECKVFSSPLGPFLFLNCVDMSKSICIKKFNFSACNLIETPNPSLKLFATTVIESVVNSFHLSMAICQNSD